MTNPSLKTQVRRQASSIQVIIKPVCLRFSIFEGDIYYHFTALPDAQLDRMEKMIGIDPGECESFTDANLGFLPVASTILIRAEKTILIDPGSPHLGFYGLLAKALQDNGLGFSEIDTLVVTHWHHDHFGNLGLFPGAELVIGMGELAFGNALYGEDEVTAKTGRMGKIREIRDEQEICPGVTVFRTPGHSPGSLCVAVDHDDNQRTVATGDTVITKEQFFTRKFSHWYSETEKQTLSESVEKIASHAPTRIIPGHDQPFETG